MFYFSELNVRKKLTLGWRSASLLVLILYLSSCQQEPCPGNKEVYAGIEIRYRDTTRTNIVNQIVSSDLSKSFGILIGRNRQYLLPLNPASDTSSFIINLTTGEQLTARITGQKTMVLLSERCGFVYNFQNLAVSGAGYDSSLTTNMTADTSRKTNFVLWVR